ncbi:hypothetical protein GCM10022254_46920 [Actinomadura meridiana]|uniref:Uncharacterized protein n=1 Tax=Actinomadura meridiana TaxID=559626 RepID=A0ABP8CAW3_9ACTN
MNENQDLREPDPEQDSDWKKLLRGLDDNLEDASKEFTKFNDNAQHMFDHRPPTDYRPGTQRDSPYPGGPPNDTINSPSAALGFVAVAMIGIAMKNGLSRIFRRNNDNNG